MKPMLSTGLLIIGALILTISSQAQQKINTGRFVQYPESVVTDGLYYYIADIGKQLNPTEKDGDGVIWKMDKAGQQVGDSAFVKGLHAPKGAVINNGILFVTDIDRVVGFDLRTRQKKYEIDCCSALGCVLLNDLAVKDKQTLFVSAMDINTIFIIHLASKPQVGELVLTNPIKGPNGLAWDARQNRLYVCSFIFGDTPAGELGFIDLKAAPRQFTRIIDRRGHYDGIAIADDSMVVVSDWVAFEKKGLLLAVYPATQQVVTINQEPVAGPADFILTPQGELIVPEMMGSAILKYTLTTKTKHMANKTAPALQNKELKVSITVNASTATVWQALTDPAIIEQYFFGSKAQSTWKEGSPVTFTGEWKGQTYQDKGTILKAVPNKILQHTYWSSMGQLEDIPENYIIVTYRLEGDDQHTELSVTQDKSTNEEESKGLWKTVLENLKKTVERK